MGSREGWRSGRGGRQVGQRSAEHMGRRAEGCFTASMHVRSRARQERQELASPPSRWEQGLEAPTPPMGHIITARRRAADPAETSTWDPEGSTGCSGWAWPPGRRWRAQDGGRPAFREARSVWRRNGHNKNAKLMISRISADCSESCNSVFLMGGSGLQICIHRRSSVLKYWPPSSLPRGGKSPCPPRRGVGHGMRRASGLHFKKVETGPGTQL